MKILWIAFVWPEPCSSAAGFRTMQLLEACRNAGHEVRICSPCQQNMHQDLLIQKGFITERFMPNEAGIDAFLNDYQPEIVFFDRFMIEEQFSWRVREHCPKALRVLDTCDLHSLRRGRQKMVKERRDPLTPLLSDLQSDDTIRELSAIYRSDCSLIVSDFEFKFLHENYHVPTELLELCRFFYSEPISGQKFGTRHHFVTIGNFNHAPNLDSYRVLHGELWGKIQTKLRALGVIDAELHIYGAYPTDEILRLNSPNEGFIVKGWTPDAKNTLSQYRVNLAPLRFGAGIKGKISDSWAVGTPCACTSIAAEGMHTGFEFGGIVEDDLEKLAEGAVKLYVDANLWQKHQQNGLQIIRELFSGIKNSAQFIKAVESANESKEVRRQNNFVGSMLWYHQHRSTEFMSRWIEAKNANAASML